MRTARTALTTLLLAGALSAAAAAAQPSLPALPHPATFNAIGVAVGVHGAVGVDFFYSNLAPYGYWVDRPSYGWVWVPRHVRHGWRPYSYGRWVYTDYGWTWVSSEPYGWATYHYGRWYDDPDYGWGWVPGTDWGPAWVDWREGGGYLGWAPLPPTVGFNAGVGLVFGGGGLAIDSASYCFVPERRFLDANVGGFIVSPGRNAVFFNNTRDITNVAVVNGRVFNRSLAVDRIQQVTGQPVRQLRLAAASDPRTVRVSGNTVSMFRPAAVVRRANAPDPRRVVPHAVATGRVAQQLQQERRGMAASARGTQAQMRQQGGNRGAVTARGTQAQMRRQGGNRGGQAVTRGQSTAGHRQVTPPPQRTRGGMPPRSGARSQQVHQYVPPSQHARSQALSQRRGQQQLHRQVTPPPQRTRGGMAPRSGARSQQVHQYVPPPQHARGPSAPMAQRQQQAQVRRQSAPPPQRMQQAPPQRMQQAQVRRQPAPPPRQMQARPQPPPRPQARAQAQRRQQPPPGGPGGR